MAFINDYLTEEEKARFEEYNVMYPRECDHAGLRIGVGNGRKSCTIDREREMFLFHARNSEDRREYDEYIDFFTLVIVKDNKPSVMYINLEKESGMTREDKDYDFLWKCRGWNMDRAKEYSQEELLEYVKEALCAYGCTGSVKNLKFNVKFDF